LGSAPEDFEQPPATAATTTIHVAPIRERRARVAAKRRAALPFNSTRSWYHAGLVRAAFLLSSSLLALSLAITGCGTTPRVEPVKVRPRAPREEPPPPWSHFAELTSLPALNARPFVNRGHDAQRGFADLRVSLLARDAYIGLVSDSVLPEGSLVALVFCDETRTEQRAVYAMQKHANGWEFLALDPVGRPDPKIDLSACPRCHEGAPADDLFGLPRSVELAPPASVSAPAVGSPTPDSTAASNPASATHGPFEPAR
jgi:hypothetical protein